MIQFSFRALTHARIWSMRPNPLSDARIGQLLHVRLQVHTVVIILVKPLIKIKYTDISNSVSTEERLISILKCLCIRKRISRIEVYLVQVYTYSPNVFFFLVCTPLTSFIISSLNFHGGILFKF